jgi:hypothetical protein
MKLFEAHHLLRNPCFGNSQHIEAVQLTSIEAEILASQKRLFDIYGYDFSVVPRLDGISNCDREALIERLRTMKRVEDEAA